MHSLGLDGTVSRIACALPASLASRVTLDDLQRVAAQLPAAIAGRMYFEAPLSSDAPRVDLIVAVERDRHEELGPTAWSRRAHHAWSRVGALANELVSPTTALRDARDVVWLEFDIEPGAPRGADVPPGVFVDFAPSTSRSRAEELALAAVALEPLLDRGALHRSRDALAECLERLPGGATLASVGVLVPRDGAAIRLCLDGLTTATLADYLRLVRWPGSLERLARLTHSLAPASDAGASATHPLPSLVHLDISAGVLPRVGIEYRFRRATQLRKGVAESEFLQRLVHDGLCTAAKRDALLGWPGCAASAMPHELWGSVVLRRLNHVKVTYVEGRPAEAKGYLCATHVPRVGHAARVAVAASDAAPTPSTSETRPLAQMQPSTQ